MADPMTNPITVEGLSDERLAEIAKGCEGVTPGPWEARSNPYGKTCQWWVGQQKQGAGHTLFNSRAINGRVGENELNAAHLANCDPQTILALVTELQHRREAEAVSVTVPVAKLLELREALVEQNGNEAYHVLYSMADPLFEKLDPWDKWEAARSASPASPSATGGRGRLTAYEAQVLIGTTISGCSMSPDRTYDLPAAWKRLRDLGLIDRTDGLAIATPEGADLVAAFLSALVEQP